LLFLKISESGISEVAETASVASSAPASSSNIHVNQWIQQLAQKYCGDCRNSFEELSKIIQKVMATRRELVAFDKKRPADSISSTSAKVVGRCYGKFLSFKTELKVLKM
jgi:E3 ubiquitin-protein ligase UBR4